MTANPFTRTDAPPWLGGEDSEDLSRILERLLAVAAAHPQLYADLPWLREMHPLTLVQEHIDMILHGRPAPDGVEARLLRFFAGVSEPVAAWIAELCGVRHLVAGAAGAPG